MKFQIKLELIKDYLRRLSVSVQSVSGRVEFTGVLINVWDDSITFEGRNDYMDTKIEEKSLKDIKIIEKGKSLIKANMLNEIIQKMEGEYVTFNKIDSSIMTIEDSNSNYKINLLEDENYERATFISETEELIIINVGDFRKSVSKTAFAGNEFHSKFIYQGMGLSIDNSILSATVCDGIRIASFKTKILSEKKIDKIIPLKVVKELNKILPSSGVVKFYFTNKKGLVIAGNMINQFSLIEGTFPVFDKFFDESIYNKTLSIDKTIFDLSIERSVILVNNKTDASNRIGLKISKKDFEIESREQEIGTAKIGIKEFEYEGEEIEISISPKILHEGLKVSEGEKIKLLMKDSSSSILLKSEDGIIYLMSPMV